MLRHSLVIFIGICLIGVTMLPASVVPCCCTFMRAQMGQQSARSACPLHVGRAPAPSTIPSTPSCCSGRMPVSATAAPCCSQSLIKQVCGKCRCHEQMHVVALPACPSCQPLGGLPVLTARFDGSTSVAFREKGRLAGLDLGIPRTGVLLQTCSLLI